MTHLNFSSQKLIIHLLNIKYLLNYMTTLWLKIAQDFMQNFQLMRLIKYLSHNKKCITTDKNSM